MLRRIGNFLGDRSVSEFICMCGIIIILVMLTFGFDFLKACFTYPEEEFQLLETEAQRIIDEKTLSTEFKNSIQYNDNLESKSVQYILYGESDTRVSITVNNYGESNQEISISRNVDNHIGTYLTIIAALAVAFFMITICGGIVFSIVVYLIAALCLKVDDILFERSRKQYD